MRGSDEQIYASILDMWSRIEPPKGPMTWICLDREAEQQMLSPSKHLPLEITGHGKATLLGYRNGELVEI